MRAARGGRGIVAPAVHRPSRLTRRALVLSALAIAALPVAAHGVAPPQLVSALDTWTAAHPETGVLVARLDPSGPTEILSYKADLGRRPASTMKVVTAAAALVALGPEHRFETRLYADQTTAYSGDRLNTTLYLKGYGDPTLGTPAYVRKYLAGSGANINRLAKSLRSFGVTHVGGAIVVDESFLDSQRQVASWPARYVVECQPLSAVNVNQGYLRDVRGAYVKRPPVAAGVQLREALKRMGVKHTGPVRRGIAPTVGRELATLKSPPLRTILGVMLPQSDNYIAEILTKDTGKYVTGTGSTAAGTQAATTLLAPFLSSQDRLVDGSGLDRTNRLAPRSMVNLLAAANNNAAWGAALIDALPNGGEGTLKRRFRAAALRNRVHAKTGYINQTSGLVGVVESPNGVRYAFAMFMNDNAIGAAQATQNRIVALLGTGMADGA